MEDLSSSRSSTVRVAFLPALVQVDLIRCRWFTCHQPPQFKGQVGRPDPESSLPLEILSLGKISTFCPDVRIPPHFPSSIRGEQDT